MKKLFKSFISAIGIAIILSTGFAELKAAPAKKTIKAINNGFIDWENRTLHVKGLGAPPDKGGAAQKRLKARIAARLDAYRNLAEVINGVRVTSETTVKDFVVKSDVVRVTVEANIKGARQINEEKYLSDGSVEIELDLPLFGNGSVASAIDLGNMVLNAPETISLDSYSSYKVAALENFARETYKIAALPLDPTGIIIDASGLGLEPAMSPFMIGGGKVIYARRVDIDPEMIVKSGVVEYANSMEDAKGNTGRIGNSPIIVEARAVTGKPARTNILLDEPTANILMEANKKNNLLNKLAVIVIL